MIQPTLLPDFAANAVTDRRTPVLSVVPKAPASPDRAEAAAGAVRQRSLVLPIASEVTLVDIQTVRALRGLDAESVSALIDAGRIRWVWDLSAPGGARRELRFLAAEAIGKAETVTASRADAIDMAIGVPASRVRVRAAELEQRWVVSNQTILRLGRMGEIHVEIVGHTKWVKRESLVKFLGRRWVS